MFLRICFLARRKTLTWKEIKRINSQIISELITKYYHEEKQFYFLDDLVDSHPYDFSDFKKINPYNSDNSRDNAFYKEYLYQTGMRTCYAVHIYKNDLDDKYWIFVYNFSKNSMGWSSSEHDNEDDIVQDIVTQIEFKTNVEKVSPQVGYVVLSENNTVVIQLYEDSKLTKGAILHLYRYYLFTDENYDIAKTKRLNDLNIGIDYLENNNKDEYLLKWKKKERQQLQDGTFLNYNHGNIGRDLGITVKIISIEGNKGIGTIIKQKHPWIEINKGDILTIIK